MSPCRQYSLEWLNMRADFARGPAMPMSRVPAPYPEARTTIAGPAPYPLAQGGQDHLLGLAIGTAARTGVTVRTQVEAWAG